MADDYKQTGYYNIQNTAGGQRNGEFYHSESGTDSHGNPGTWHDYPDGTKEFIAAQPTTISVPAPPVSNFVAAAPAPAAAAPAAPSTPAPTAPSQPTVVNSTPQPETGFTPPTPPAFDHSNPNVYENPTTHDVYQVADASSHGQWHVYQSGPPQWVAAPTPGGGFDIKNLTPAQYAAQQAAAPSSPLPTVASQTPQPITGGGLSTAGSTGGPTAPSDPTTGAPSNFGGSGTIGGPTSTSSSTDGTAAPQTGSVVPGGAPINNNPNLPNVVTTGGGAVYTVKEGDTLTKIAEQNGMSVSKLEGLNPQIANPDLIRPGESVNLGGAPSIEVAQPLTSSSSGFPEHSTYPPSDGSQTQIAAKAEQAGWSAGTDSGTSDPAKGIMEASTKADTDPLKINNDKSHQI